MHVIPYLGGDEKRLALDNSFIKGTAERLADLRPGCLVIDLASKPWGVDFEAAVRQGVRAIWALSLPGKVAPVTSGKIIRDTIYNIWNELGV